MVEKREKDPQFVTPAGSFIYPRLGEPDTKFKAEGEYSVKQRLSREAAAVILKQLAPLHAEAVEVGQKKFAELPVATRKKLKELTVNDLYAIDYDDEENETGDIIFKFGMTASGKSKKTGKPWERKPRVFDAKRNAMDSAKVWGGSVGKVCFTARPYFNPGAGACGVSLKLEAVQVLELVTGGQKTGAAYGFGEEDGYSEHSEPEQEDTEDTGGSSGEDDDGDF